jgi:AraC-like DNA-binding protein
LIRCLSTCINCEVTSEIDREKHLRHARDLMDRNFSNPALDLDQIAAVAFMSKSHFVRKFSEQFGLTPGAYLTGRRIERAQNLLRFANLTVTEVCQAVGLSSLGSFSAAFRAVTGESPSVFQRRWFGIEHPRIPGCEILMQSAALTRAL